MQRWLAASSHKTTQNEPAHDKTYNKSCATRKYSGQPVHPTNMARILVYPFLDCLAVVKGTCDQWRLWSACADAQADLSLRWSHKSYCRLCRALAQIWMNTNIVVCKGTHSSPKPRRIGSVTPKEKNILSVLLKNGETYCGRHTALNTSCSY